MWGLKPGLYFVQILSADGALKICKAQAVQEAASGFKRKRREAISSFCCGRTFVLSES